MAGRNQQVQDEEEDVIEIGEEDQPEEGEQVDRGDNPEPEVTLGNLKKVAGAGADEEEETPEEDEDAEAGAGKPPKTIPYGRFAKVVKQLSELEAKVNAQAAKPAVVEEEEEAAEPFDHDGKEEAYLKAVSEGDFATAKALRREINEALKSEAKEEATQEAVASMTKSQASRDFAAAVADTLKAYPWLNDKGDDADDEAIEEVVVWRNYYISKGKSPADALREAAAKVAKTRDADAEEEEAEEGAEPKPKLGKAKAETKEEKIKRMQQERARAANERGAKAAEQQPPAAKGGKGNRASEEQQLNIEDMDDDEFDKLPMAEKKIARGD